MHILLIEPYFTGSHRQWAEAWRRHSRHRIDILSLPGRYWKWRMLGGAVELADQFTKIKEKPDLIIASDMLNLTSFLALTGSSLKGIPIFVYFHENQLTYPWSPTDPDKKLARNHQYGFINYTSALAADRVFFNSAFHQQSFLQGVEDLLRQLPDFQGVDNARKIRDKSLVLPLGLELKKLPPPSSPPVSPPPSFSGITAGNTTKTRKHSFICFFGFRTKVMISGWSYWESSFVSPHRSSRRPGIAFQIKYYISATLQIAKHTPIGYIDPIYYPSPASRIFSVLVP